MEQSGLTPFAEHLRERKRKIRELAEQGAYATEIGRVLGMNRSTVRYHASTMGLVLPHGKRRPVLPMFRSQVETGRGFIDYPAEGLACPPQSRL